MKIGILTSIGRTVDAFFPPLIGRWEEQGNEVVTAASASSYKVSNHTILPSITRNPSLLNLCGPSEIKTWIKDQDIDVLVTNTATASFLARVRRMPVPVIYFCHGLHWNEAKGLSNRFWQGLEHVCLRNTDAVVVINHDDETWFSQRFTQGEIYRLPGGVGVPVQSYPRSPIPSVDRVVQLLWAGEFSERKRPWLAVETMQKLSSQGISVHLTMCGDGPYFDCIKKLVEDLGLEKSISLIGRTQDIPKILSDSHALLMTSAWEGLPRIGLEAIAVGRPVFAFDVKGTRSLPGVILAPEQAVEDLSRIISEHIKGNFLNVDFIDPDDLHPNYAADKIANIAQRLIGPAG